MNTGMGPMGPHMREAMAAGRGHGVPEPMRHVAIAAASNPSLLGRLARHPWLLFGLGVATGILVYKYRKQIVGAAVRLGEQGRDLLLEGKETLEDLVEEGKGGEASK